MSCPEVKKMELMATEDSKIFSCLKFQQENNNKSLSMKGCNNFSIESILGLTSQKVPSDDDEKINRLELMDFSQKGELIFLHLTCV